jgi:hypothetical protein
LIDEETQAIPHEKLTFGVQLRLRRVAVAAPGTQGIRRERRVAACGTYGWFCRLCGGVRR